jgi:putative peptidoglycan lipid II flippase
MTNPTVPNQPDEGPVGAVATRPESLPEATGRSSIASSAASIAVATMTSRLLGLVRDQVLAAMFGAGNAMDAYQVAFRIPNLFRDLFAEGAMSAAFVPTFTDHLTRRGKRSAWTLANHTINGLLLVSAAVVVVMMVFAEPLVTAFASNFADVDDKLALTVMLARIMLPSLVLVAVAAALMGMLNSLQHFFVPALAPAVFNAVNIACAIAFVPLMPAFGFHPITAIAVGTLLGAGAQLAIQLPALRREGFVYRRTMDWRDPGVRRVLMLMGPGTIGLAATQMNIFVNTVLATSQGTGAVSWLSFGFRLVYLPIGLFSVSIATAMFPAVARQNAQKDVAAVRGTLSDSISLMMMLTIPATVGLMVLSTPIVQVAFERSAFTAADTAATAAVVRLLALGLLGYSLARIAVPAFYALGETRTTVKASIAAVVVNATTSFGLVQVMGYQGLALGNSIAAVFNAAVLLLVLRRRVHGLNGWRLLSSCIRISIAAGAMGVVAAATHALFAQWLPGTGTLPRLVQLGGAMIVSLVVLVLTALALRIQEIKNGLSSLARRLRDFSMPATSGSGRLVSKPLLFVAEDFDAKDVERMPATALVESRRTSGPATATPERDERARPVGQLKLLVVLASYGERNITFLKKVISTYQDMSFKTDIVVLSEAPKDLGPDVTVVVGLPSKDPWSLPFGHKKIFAANVDRYDLFAYSEDDMVVTETNISSFVTLSGALDEHSLPGYLRYETTEDGDCYLPDVHGPFHWKPESVREAGSYTVAEFTNEHAAFFLLTREHLKRAIASGGFLRGPYRDKHDMLCTAATDPYITCGFRKVVGISHLDNFLIHHLSRRYLGTLGCPMGIFREQVGVLLEIGRGVHPVATLCEVEPVAFREEWAKGYYEPYSAQLSNAVPPGAQTILSIGCGWGETESALARRGAHVTALPLDSVIAAIAQRRGIDVVLGTLEQGLAGLAGRRFSCILVSNLLHLQKDPAGLIAMCSSLLESGGSLVVASPNFEALSVAVKRAFRVGKYDSLREFDVSGIHLFSAAAVAAWMREAGLASEAPIWCSTTRHANVSGALTSMQRLRAKLGSRIIFRKAYGKYDAASWIVSGVRSSCD